MRVLRDAHGTPPVPNRDRSCRSLPEPGAPRRTSQGADLDGERSISMRTRPRIIAALGAIGLAATVAVAGCSADSGSGSATDSSERNLDAPAAAPAKGAPEAAQGDQAAARDSQGGQDQAAKAPDLSVDQRSIVYTGAITVRVDDVNIAAARASGIATAAGGFVSGDKRNSGAESQDATLELRVPAAKFSPVVTQLAELGKEEQRGINTEDVTEQTIDLDA